MAGDSPKKKTGATTESRARSQAIVKPSLAVANRPSRIAQQAADHLRHLAAGPSTLKIELREIPEWHTVPRKIVIPHVGDIVSCINDDTGEAWGPVRLVKTYRRAHARWWQATDVKTKTLCSFTEDCIVSIDGIDIA